MRILSHRGFWGDTHDKNSQGAFSCSLDSGCGLETDIRDMKGDLVISHDSPESGVESIKSLLDLVSEKKDPGLFTLALNIKADGLALKLKDKLGKYPKLDYFVFDMSVPDMRSYMDAEIPFYTRVSEVEAPIWYEAAQGIWLDGFESDWYDAKIIERYILDKKEVCVVSPELHGRDHKNVWAMLKIFSGNSNFLLCTDFPELAYEFFYRDE